MKRQEPDGRAGKVEGNGAASTVRAGDASPQDPTPSPPGNPEPEHESDAEGDGDDG